MGQFDQLALPELADGLAWDTSALLANGSLAVIPEPTGLVLLGIALLIGQQFPRGWREWRTITFVGCLNSAIPFFLIMCAMAILIAVFPDIVTFLPDTIHLRG